MTRDRELLIEEMLLAHEAQIASCGFYSKVKTAEEIVFDDLRSRYARTEISDDRLSDISTLAVLALEARGRNGNR